MRKHIVSRLKKSITQDSSKDSDGDLLKEFCEIADYQSDEFKYVKEKLEHKYGFKFKNYYKRSDSVEYWHSIKDSLSLVKKSDTKKSAKPKIINDNHWANACVEDLSPSQALQRFNDLKAKERRERLLEEVRNVDLFCNEVV